LPVGGRVSIHIISCDRHSYYFMWSSDIFYQYNYSFIFCDVSECSLYLYSWYECLSALFHMIVGCL